jgi:hypothetical protein
MRRTLFRTALSSGLLAAAVVVGGLALDARLAHPQEAPKGDLLATAPVPQAKPTPACRLPVAALAELAGWRILEGRRAVDYLSTAFKKHPPADTLAYAIAGDKVALALAKDGCIVGQLVIPAKTHRLIVTKVLGIAV